MTEEIIGYLISSTATIVCSILAYISNKEHKQAQAERERTKKSSEQHAKENLLLLKLIHADCSLTVGTALAIKRGKCNGELEQGLRDVESAMNAYDDFHDEIAMNNLHKN